MRQVVRNNRGEVYVREAPMPRLEGSGAIVETICSVFGAGSELGSLQHARDEYLRGATANEAPVEEHPLSYQSSGRIVELSNDLKGLYQIGDMVACAGGGFGSHADYGYVPKNTMAHVPEEVAPEEAACNNLGLTGLHILRRAEFKAGELIVVIGLGLVGQFTAQLAAAFGGRAIGSDLYELRLATARTCGIEATVNARTEDLVSQVDEHTGGLGADHVCICVTGGGKSITQQAVRVVRDSGIVLLVGGYEADFTGSSDPLANPHIKEIDVRWVYGRGPGSRDPGWNHDGTDYPIRFLRWTAKTNLEAFLELQATGRVRTAPLLTHTFPVERAGEAADLLIENPDETLGVVLTYNRS